MRARVGWWALALMLAGCATPKTAAPDPAASLPRDANVLFWTQDQRDVAFRHMERLSPTRLVAAGGTPRALPRGAKLGMAGEIPAFMDAQRSAGLIIVHRGRVRYERYALGFGPDQRWTSFSVAKSLTGTLVGAALADGAIKSLDDPVARYVPDLSGSAYADVSVRQLLTMTSGVQWDESYVSPTSDVARFLATPADPGVDATVSYMRRLPRAAAPGTRWHYSTGETNLVGVLVSSATGKRLSDYLSEKIWKPYGMEADAVWMTGSTGHEIAGCCISMRLRDYARVGQFMLDGGRAGGRAVVPAGWVADATASHADIGGGAGYGYQWWIKQPGTFAAQGIFGQGIFVDPKRQLVIASLSSWPVASDAKGLGAQREAFYRSVQAAIDAEGAR